MKPLLLLLAMLLTACGHIEYQPLATIDHVDHSRGDRLQPVFHTNRTTTSFSSFSSPAVARARPPSAMAC